MTRFELVAVGCSWGGLDAVGSVLAGLPETFRTPLAVALHRGTGSDDAMLSAVLERRARRPVRSVEDKEPIVPGWVYIAPSDYHLLVEPGTFSLSVDDRVNYSRPSIDVLFESAADAYGQHAIGVILTGANRDGANGLARIKRRGGYAVVQDPATAVRRVMPDAAIAGCAVDRVLPLERIAPLLVELCARPRVRESSDR